MATTIPVACAVVYGTDERFGSIATDDDMAGGAHRDHAPLLSGLEPDTEYRYVLQGSDAEGNLYRSQVQTFRTPAATGDDAAGRNVAPQGRVVDVSSEFSDDFVAGVRLRSHQMSDGSAIIRSFTVTVDDTEPFGPYDAGADQLTPPPAPIDSSLR